MSRLTDSPGYSDASSTYWPPGWSFARWTTTTLDDLCSLPEDEMLKTQNGLREVLGEEGYEDLGRWMWEQEQARTETQAERDEKTWRTRESEPNWLMHWRRWYAKREGVEGRRWGFVGFRGDFERGDGGEGEGNEGGGGADGRWEEFKRRVGRVVGSVFEGDEGRDVEGFEDAKGQWEVRWVEDGDLRGLGVEGLRARYKEMISKGEIPEGLRQEVFLVASSKAVESFLALDWGEDDGEQYLRKARRWWRDGAPYLLAVAAEEESALEECHEENEWLKPVFKIAAEVLVGEFWPTLDSGGSLLRRITRCVKADGELEGATTAPGEEGRDAVWWSMLPSPESMKRRRRIG